MKKMWSLMLAVLMFCVPVISGAESVYTWPMEALQNGQTLHMEQKVDAFLLEVTGEDEEQTEQMQGMLDAIGKLATSVKTVADCQGNAARLQVLINNTVVFDLALDTNDTALLLQSSWLGENVFGFKAEELKELLKNIGFDPEQGMAQMAEFNPAEQFPNTLAALQALAGGFAPVEEVTQPEDADPAVAEASGTITGEQLAGVLNAAKQDILADEEMKNGFTWNDGYTNYTGEEAVEKCFEQLTAQAECVSVTVTAWVNAETSPVAIDVTTVVNKSKLETLTDAYENNARVDYMTGLGYGEGLEKKSLEPDPDAAEELTESTLSYRALTDENGVVNHSVSFADENVSLNVTFYDTDAETVVLATSIAGDEENASSLALNFRDEKVLRGETEAKDVLTYTVTASTIGSSATSFVVNGSNEISAEKGVLTSIATYSDMEMTMDEMHIHLLQSGTETITVGEALPELDAENAVYPLSMSQEEQQNLLGGLMQNLQLGAMRLVQQLPAELLVLLNGGSAQ